MNVLIDSDRTIPATESRHGTTTAGPNLAIRIEDLRVITTGLVGREAAISAGHHALARLVTTRQVGTDR